MSDHPCFQSGARWQPLLPGQHQAWPWPPRWGGRSRWPREEGGPWPSRPPLPGFLWPFPNTGPDLPPCRRVLPSGEWHCSSAASAAAAVLRVPGKSSWRLERHWGGDAHCRGPLGWGGSALQQGPKLSHSSSSPALLPLPCVFQDMEA